MAKSHFKNSKNHFETLYMEHGALWIGIEYMYYAHKLLINRKGSNMDARKSNGA